MPYGQILLKIVNDAGGDELTNRIAESTYEFGVTDEAIAKEEFTFSKLFKNTVSDWNTERVQYFLIYVAMAFNTARKARELLKNLQRQGRESCQTKFCRQISLKCNVEFYVKLEEQLIELMRATILTRFDTIFEFSKHGDWDMKKYGRFSLILSYCKRPGLFAGEWV